MSPNLASRIQQLLAQELWISAIYLFGSQATEQSTPASDIDIALLYEPGHIPDLRSTLALRDQLAAHLGRNRVDLVVLNRANPILKYQVFRHGKCLTSRNLRHQRRFLVRSMTEYADLKHMRAPIERALLRGRIHGR